MEAQFEDLIYKEICHRAVRGNGGVIKAADASIKGFTKITLEQESHDSVKIILKKDEKDNVKEIKFICSCGETKSVLLDYTEE